MTAASGTLDAYSQTRRWGTSHRIVRAKCPATAQAGTAPATGADTAHALGVAELPATNRNDSGIPRKIVGSNLSGYVGPQRVRSVDLRRAVRDQRFRLGL